MKKAIAIVLMLMLVLFSIAVYAEESTTFEELGKGSRGDDVVRIQERLNELGFSVGKADGQFGKKTEAAVKSFQELNGLEITGIIDEKTNECLYSDNVIQATPAPTPEPTPSPKPTATPKLYSKDDCIAAAEYALLTDGMWGAVNIVQVKAEDNGNHVQVSILYDYYGGGRKVFWTNVSKKDLGMGVKESKPESWWH